MPELLKGVRRGDVSILTLRRVREEPAETALKGDVRGRRQALTGLHTSPPAGAQLLSQGACFLRKPPALPGLSGGLGKAAALKSWHDGGSSKQRPAGKGGGKPRAVNSVGAARPGRKGRCPFFPSSDWYFW